MEKKIHLPCGNKPLHTGECCDCSEVAQRVTVLEECCETVQAKLDTIEEGAEVNVQADWDEADNTKDDYIKNKPFDAETSTIASGQTSTTITGDVIAYSAYQNNIPVLVDYNPSNHTFSVAEAATSAITIKYIKG